MFLWQVSVYDSIVMFNIALFKVVYLTNFFFKVAAVVVTVVVLKALALSFRYCVLQGV